MNWISKEEYEELGESVVLQKCSVLPNFVVRSGKVDKFVNSMIEMIEKRKTTNVDFGFAEK